MPLLPPTVKLGYHDATKSPYTQPDGSIGREVLEGFYAQGSGDETGHTGCTVNEGFLSAGQVGIVVGDDFGQEVIAGRGSTDVPTEKTALGITVSTFAVAYLIVIGPGTKAVAARGAERCVAVEEALQGLGPVGRR